MKMSLERGVIPPMSIQCTLIAKKPIRVSRAGAERRESEWIARSA
jgi:hypothetical protein